MFLERADEVLSSIWAGDDFKKLTSHWDRALLWGYYLMGLLLHWCLSSFLILGKKTIFGDVFFFEVSSVLDGDACEDETCSVRLIQRAGAVEVGSCPRKQLWRIPGRKRRHRIKDIMGGKTGFRKFVGAKFKKMPLVKDTWELKKRIGMELKMEIRYGVFCGDMSVSFFPGSQAICWSQTSRAT